MSIFSKLIVIVAAASLAWAEDKPAPKSDQPAERAKAAAAAPATAQANVTAESAKSPLDFSVRNIDGQDVALSKFRGEVLLIVNVASKCGLTKRNYAELEPLFQKYKDRGLRVLAFPANNFLGQEPGSNADIKKTCTEEHGVTFDLFEKISVKGDDQHELYKYLTKKTGDFSGEIEWNFAKFLVDREGKVVGRFSPRTNPSDEKLVAAIEKALSAASTKAGEKTSEKPAPDKPGEKPAPDKP